MVLLCSSRSSVRAATRTDAAWSGLSGALYSARMTHVFVAPHPDDAALSCGGLIASLRELGQNVTILTVFSGSGGTDGLSPYQREALGFGTKTMWPVTEAFNRANVRNDWPVYDNPQVAPPWAATSDRLEATQTDADGAAKRFWQRSSWYRRASIRAESLAGQAVIDTLPTQGAVYTDEVMDAAAAGEIAARRRMEDERFAYFAEASIVFLDVPDAVFRGYEGDNELLGRPRHDDVDVYDMVRREITRLEPQKVYLPLGVGDHVDHQLCRAMGLRLLQESRQWIMPGPEYAGIVAFYEDFPYAWWKEFRRLDELPDDALDALPADVALVPQYADVSDQLERKITGIGLYASQLDPLFGGERQMADAVRGHGRQIGALGGIDGFAERYWASEPI
jgi:LmbE family N-acetylglucosaminyl deacetylase